MTRLLSRSHHEAEAARRKRKITGIISIAMSGLIIAIDSINRCRERSFLRRQALLHPKHSPWTHLLNYGDENSFMNITGMNFTAFRNLVSIIKEAQETNNEEEHPRRVAVCGRKPLIDIQTRVGILILFLNSTMRLKFICMVFGTTPSRTSAVIRSMLRTCVETLRKIDLAKVKWPSEERMAELAEMVANREPEIQDVIGFIDGVRFLVECNGDPNIQTTFYSGYLHDTNVNNVLFFTADGIISFACINAPGCLHDSIVSKELIATSIQKLNRYKVCVDQGFPRSGLLFDKFVGPLSKKRIRNLAQELRAWVIHLSNKYVSLRQSSEWGMRALQGSFTRLKTRLPSDSVYRQYIIEACVLLHNYRTNMVGLNQIASLFNLEYENFINLEGYDRIRRYFASESGD